MNKVDERVLMALLYGELEPDEQKRVEEQLKNQPEMAAKFNELKEVSHFIGKLEDQEPGEPLIIDGTPDNTKLNNWAPWLAAAASLLLLVVVGFLTNTSISIDQNRLTMTFGKETATRAVSGVNSEELTDALKQQEELFSNRVHEMHEDITNKLSVLEQGSSSQNGSISESELQAYLTTYRERQLAEMTSLLEQNISSQRGELKAFLTEYHQFLEERRLQDLQLIEAGFQAMQEDVYKQKTETDEILANILTTAKNTNY